MIVYSQTRKYFLDVTQKKKINAQTGSSVPQRNANHDLQDI